MMTGVSPFGAPGPSEYQGRRRIAMQPGFEGNQLPEALHLIEGFVDTDGLDKKIEYLRRHSFLLTDDALRFVGDFEKAAEEEGSAEMAGIFASHRVIIETVREFGFNDGAERLRVLVLMTTVKDFMDGYSWWDSYLFLQKHPELLSEDAQDLLVLQGKQAHDQGDQEAEKVIYTHFRLLRRVAEVGPEKAFTEVGGKDFTAALQRSAWAPG
jgi:hypothetical protein